MEFVTSDLDGQFVFHTDSPQFVGVVIGATADGRYYAVMILDTPDERVVPMFADRIEQHLADNVMRRFNDATG